MLLTIALWAAATAAVHAAPTTPQADAASVVNQTTCNGQTYTYEQLAGYGFSPSNARDKFGDTLGGIGSSAAFQRGSWVKTSTGYTGIIYALPDRGWNTNGTLNYQTRVQKFRITLTPQPNATAANPSSPNIQLTYLDTIKFTGPYGKPATGIDGSQSGHLDYPLFPDLPVANFSGDGFGGPGNGDRLLPVDSEGLVANLDGTFWVSDEYGPYIYRFAPTGQLLQAIRPPDAFIPIRNNTESWSADSPPAYAPNITPTPADPTSGRDNNHGFEGLTASPDGRYLYALIQAALVQEGGLSSTTERYARLIQYDILSLTPRYIAEYVVPLPLFNNGKKIRVAAQSEIHFVSPTQFLILARDSGAGHGQSSSTSLYRHADVFDISNATNIAGATYDCQNCSIASTAGILKPGIVPATYCSFLDYNVNSQLNKFGVHNGGAQDSGLLNEKWESLALAPVDGLTGADGEFFLFSFSDNDFITQDGYLNGGKYRYKDGSGFNLDDQVLAFRVSLPTGSRPLVG